MNRPQLPMRVFFCLTVLVALAASGCEGVFTRSHDINVDVDPPSDAELAAAQDDSAQSINIADEVEHMMMIREQYHEALASLEGAYLKTGDTVKANWARRQRENVKRVEVYPYLSETTQEYRAEVSPEESIPEADAMFAEAETLYEEVKLIPAAGALEATKNKARDALILFKTILVQYPKSDKVDDCSFYCGAIYKEYLRDDDPDNELAVRYYRWAFTLNPDIPHPARFHCAVVLDYRRHERDKALELYHQVLEESNDSNARWSATRIEQLTDEEFSHERPRDRVPYGATPPRTYSDRQAPAVAADRMDDDPDPTRPDLEPPEQR